MAFFVFLLVRGVHAKPQVAPKVDSQALQYLDSDAAIVLGLDLGQFQSLYAFARHASPRNSAAIDLAALAATTIFGWNPTRTEGWKSRGFDISSPALLQIAAPRVKHTNRAQPGASLVFWRTRLVLKSSDVDKSTRALQAMRLREKASIGQRPKAPDISALGALLNVNESESKRAHARFRKEGVFAVASLSPLPGLLVASADNGYLLLDFLLPHRNKLDWNNPRHREEVFSAIARKPGALTANLPGIDALTTQALGMWMQPQELAALLRQGRSGKQHIACSRVGALIKNSPFSAVSGQLKLSYKRRRTKKHNEFLQADLRWHWASSVPWKSALTVGTSPLGAHSQSLFRLDILLDSVAGFLLAGSTPDAWIPLWKAARDCGAGSKTLAAVSAWPEILGALLTEISSLHPKANTFLQSLGVASLWIAPTPTGSKTAPILAEAWLRSPGNAIARDWLSQLFGSGQKTGRHQIWGQGPIKPYAIEKSGGSIIGAGFSHGARNQRLSQRGLTTPSAGTLLRFSAQPQKLVRVFPKPMLPMRSLALLWSKVDAQLTIEGRSLHLRFRAE